MAQSLNTKVDLVMDATSFHGMNNYGKIMIGDRGFEYYNEKKMNDYIQIPWEEVDYVIASVMFKGKYIPRFAIQTKRCGKKAKRTSTCGKKVCSIRPHGSLVKLF